MDGLEKEAGAPRSPRSCRCICQLNGCVAGGQPLGNCELASCVFPSRMEEIGAWCSLVVEPAEMRSEFLVDTCSLVSSGVEEKEGFSGASTWLKSSLRRGALEGISGAA